VRATREAARAERLARSGSKEMNSVMVTKEDAEREEAEILGQGRTGNDEAEKARQAQEEAERAAKEAAEKEREAKAAQETAERTAREAEQKANEATAALKELERKWTKGIQPEVWPTIEELEAAKERYEYTEGSLHFAIAGVAGSGKSSLINAVRCLHNKKAGAAPTGVVETTTETTRYPSLDRAHPIVWYDIPGAGTLDIPDWEYFNTQGLYIFDCIVVLFDNRFTSIDVAILKNCARFNIPSYIVRSKADQHIGNMIQESMMGSDDEDDDAIDHNPEMLAKEARDKFISSTRENVRVNLTKAGLAPQQRVYIVSRDKLLGLIKGKRVVDMIDEEQLTKDLLTDARARRPEKSQMGNALTVVYHSTSKVLNSLVA